MHAAVWFHGAPRGAVAVMALAGCLCVLHASPAAARTSGARLVVRVVELPGGVRASVRVRGPHGYSRRLTGTGALTGLRPGSYRIAAADVHAGASLFVARLSGSRVRLRGGHTRRVVVSYRGRVPDSTKTLKSSAVRSLTGAPGGPQSVILSAGATASGPRHGDVLVAGVSDAAPDGLLGRVTDVTSLAAGRLRVRLRPAALTDALPSGDITVSRRRARTAADDEVVQQVKKLVSCGGGQVDVSGQVSATAGVYLDAHWGGLLHPALKQASFTGAIKETAELSATASSPSCTFGPFDLGGPKRFAPITVAVGPVPVVLIPVLSFHLKGAGDVGATLTGRVRQSFDASAGVKYEGGQFTPIKTLSNDFDFDQPALSVSAKLGASIEAQLSLLVYGVAGPDVTIGAGMDLAANPLLFAPTPWWTLTGTLHGGAGLELLSLHWSKPDLLSFSKLLASGTRQPAGAGTGAGGNPVGPGGGAGGGGGGAGRLTPVSAGLRHTCAVLANGGVSCWGYNGDGELGSGATAGPQTCSVSDPCSTTPVTVSAITNATAVSAGWQHACALLATRRVVCWGDNASGELGNGTTSPSATPVGVSAISDATQISVDAISSCALQATGRIACWGRPPGVQQTPTPVQVSAITNATQISTGGDVVCALLATGRVQCWGANTFGTLGNGTTTASATPVGVSAIINATQVSVGSGGQACALLATGRVDCWGNNLLGELGIGTTSGPQTCSGDPCSTTPVQVSGITNAVEISAGRFHTCARLATGQVDCWGSNAASQLGSTTPPSIPAPVAIPVITNATAISAGGAHTCARLATGQIACLGDNTDGELGDGTTTTAVIPVLVTGIG